MNRTNAAFATALAFWWSGVALGVGVHSNAEVHTALLNQGYTDITNVQQDNRTWTADATAGGNTIKLRINASTGQVYPDGDTAKSQAEILAAVTAAGYINVSQLKFYGGVWTARATSSTGKDVEINIDPVDAKVTEE
jgi:hypothetical protein